MKEDTGHTPPYLYENKKPGDSVKLTVEREGKQQKINVTLKEQSQHHNLLKNQVKKRAHRSIKSI